MTVGVVDSTVIVHLFRKAPSALTWYDSLSQAASRYANHMDGNHVWCSRQSGAGEVQGYSQ